MLAGMGPAGRIGRFFIDSKLTPLLVVAALVTGAIAVVMTPREEEPQIVVPVMDVFVGLPGSSPLETESRVTLPLEKRFNEIPGVEYVYSTSLPGVSMVTVRFEVGQDQERSLVKVYEKLASGLDQIPPGATPPLVKVRTIDDVPVLALTLWSSERDGFELRRIAAELAGEIDRVDDISRIALTGGQRRELLVELDAMRMAAYGVDPAGLVAALQMQNAAMPAGSFADGNREVLVETGRFLRDAEEVAALVVAVHQGAPVYLRDVAVVRDGPAEADSYVFFVPGPAGQAELGASGPQEAVTMSVSKRQGADAFAVVESALQVVQEHRGGLLGDDVHVTVTRNYGATAREKADELLWHLTLAIVSVTVVIGLALGWRGALVVFVSVPVSFALTLFVYYLFGYTLNRVTLFALIFVTGIVVDDSIIVVENIVRHFSMHQLPPRQAAITAVNEVGNPTILATLTVIASVLPMAFVRGLMGPYMAPMPVGASIAMIFSLLVAFIAAPWFSYRLLRGGAHGGDAYDLLASRTYRVYRWLLAPLIHSGWKRWGFLGGVTLLLALSVALFPLGLVSVKMLPFDNKNELQVILDMPEGTTLEATARVAAAVAESLASTPEVTDMQLYVGTSAPLNFNGLVRHYDLRRGPNVADVQVNFVHKDERDDQSHDLAKRIRPQLEELAARYGVALKIAEVPPGPPVMATLVAEVYGPDDASRLQLATQVRDVFVGTEGVVDVDWTVEAERDKTVFLVDLERAALHGVPAAAITRALRLALSGEDAGTLHVELERDPVAIRLRLPRAERSSLTDLASIRLRSMAGAMVPLSDLVTTEQVAEPRARFRKNLRPLIYVTGDVAGARESPVYAMLEMAERIDGLEAPEGGVVEQRYRDEPLTMERASLKWDGEWQITYEVFRDLGIAFGLVLVLIYFLIIGWFGSFRVPLVMMIAIPLALVGVLPGHWLSGAFFTATSMIGFIALAGIMVRNSVLLIDFVELARERGVGLEEAVIEAGAVRFRPILLTAGTVVVGAVVILFDPIFQGLAIALMGGAMASTVLTLLVVPLVHYMVESGSAGGAEAADGPNTSAADKGIAVVEGEETP